MQTETMDCRLQTTGYSLPTPDSKLKTPDTIAAGSDRHGMRSGGGPISSGTRNATLAQLKARSTHPFFII